MVEQSPDKAQTVVRFYTGEPILGREVKEVVIRRVLKAVTWRLVSALLTLTVVFFMTGSIIIAMALMSLEVVKLFAFMLHDHIWSKVKVGK